MAVDFNAGQLALATSILSFYNTRTLPRLFEVEESEVLKKVALVFDTASEDLEALFFGYFQRKALPEATAEKTLSELKNKGVKMAVLTDAPYGMPKRFIQDDLGSLQTWLDEVCTSCDIGYRKPHPYGLEYLMAKHGASIETTVFVGNEAKDVECATRAGVTSMLLDPIGENEFGQDYRIKELSDVMDIDQSLS